MRFLSYLKEDITQKEINDLVNRWKTKLKPYGITNVGLSTHALRDSLNRKDKNSLPMTIDDLEFIMDGFLRKEGSQFKQDIEDVKNNVAKRKGRGMSTKKVPPNNLEFVIKSASRKANLVIVLKQDNKQKGTAMVLIITMMKKKGKFKTDHTKGAEIIVERKVIR